MSIPQAKILSLCASVPAQIIPNSDFYSLYGGEKSALRVFKTVGIKERRIAPPGMTALDLSIQAARATFEESTINPEDIDAIVFTTQTRMALS